MRRRDKAIVDEADLLAVIEEATVCRLGLVDGDRPYVVPVCFGYRDGALYVHGAPEGRKVDLLRRNPNVCFEFDLTTGSVPSEKACAWTMRYRSVIGFGRAAFVEGLEEKREALGVIVAHYAAGATAFPDEAVAATSVVRVEVESMTGKKSGVW